MESFFHDTFPHKLKDPRRKQPFVSLPPLGPSFTADDSDCGEKKKIFLVWHGWGGGTRKRGLPLGGDVCGYLGTMQILSMIALIFDFAQVPQDVLHGLQKTSNTALGGTGVAVLHLFSPPSHNGVTVEGSSNPNKNTLSNAKR